MNQDVIAVIVCVGVVIIWIVSFALFMKPPSE